MIEIHAELIDRMIHIKVINPGHLKVNKEPHAGLGLINSQHRLHLLYGETAQIDLQPLNKNQVCATVQLPYLEEI